ncbi:transcription elongation factor A N-terminal and central domain-containing protein [Erinaceus europaeus]|uniref:Transcription elongation factor A N-terminal and central domain-containing protein n=1 Tax=Erinaceus europaeus TaxID=9365 RepID=A0A1S2ZD40_ERIEU|nr:transcription elongation factor A N-terminal and central domain-containing protein [Erinaceus europaeus]
MSDKKHIAARASLIEQLVSQRDFEDLGSHLTELETLQVTKEHLQETDVTRAVHRVLKNCPTVSLRRRAKHLLSDWKALYQPQDSPSSFPVGGEKEGSPGLALDPRQQESVGVSISDSLPLPQDVLTEATKTPGNGAGQVGPPEKQFRRGSDKRASELLGPTAPVRTKCTELLYEALAASSAGQPTATLRRDFARQIEDCSQCKTSHYDSFASLRGVDCKDLGFRRYLLAGRTHDNFICPIRIV